VYGADTDYVKIVVRLNC